MAPTLTNRIALVTVEIEGEEKPALVVDWLGLIYFA